MYEICRLFPEESFDKIEGSQHSLKDSKVGDSFDTVIQKYNFSHEFVAFLRQMLKVDRNDRIPIADLLDAFDVIVENEHNYLKREIQLKE